MMIKLNNYEDALKTLNEKEQKIVDKQTFLEFNAECF